MPVATSLNPDFDLRDLGLLPFMLDESDPRPAREQINDNYQHGGGWSPFKGFSYDQVTNEITYPEDQPLAPLARIEMRDEIILVYECSWVLILQPSGSWEIARID